MKEPYPNPMNLTDFALRSSARVEGHHDKQISNGFHVQRTFGIWTGAAHTVKHCCLRLRRFMILDMMTNY
jgi:hypothetical protein